MVTADGIWEMQGVERILYRLSEVRDADRVIVVEGEKGTDNVAKMGLTATCNVSGAGKWRPEYNEPLRGKHVVIIADADPA